MNQELKEMKSQYTPEQLAACAGAREVRDGEVVIVGVGLSNLTGAIAKLVHAPNAILVTEAGYIDFKGIATMVSPDDPYGGTLCTCHTSLTQVFSDQQRGFMDVGYVSFVQIDKYGNVNTTALFGSGDYNKPELRLQGSGGGGDISSSANRCVYINVMRDTGQFVNKLDFMTFPGFLDGHDSRQNANLSGGGPSAVITDRGVFRFEEESKEMYLSEVFPWDEDNVEEIKGMVEWNLKVTEDLQVIDPPRPKEMEAIRLLDPGETWTIPNLMERPTSKILLFGGLLEGKRTFEMYDKIGELYESSWRIMLNKRLPI
ncbi:MAG: CoA-transferase [Chloroflexota bacterium]|nr:CoA-transferase [Chloroflexota bacterium]